LSTVVVNGRTYEVELSEDRSLAELLRDQLGLTGTKIGCNEGVCGACTVILNGRAVRSCRIPSTRAEGAVIETIEGLARDGELHPLQRAFIEHGAVQCGFCTPGMIMSAKALLDRHRKQGTVPTEAEIRRALKGNLCRCTGYHAVVRAVLSAAGQPVSPHVPKVSPGRYIGRPLPRKDAADKVTGRAVYADDLRFPGMLYAAVRRAGVPHARIISVDTAAARRLPGVHAVITAGDVPGEKRHGLVRRDWPVFCAEKVRYVGDALAAVAAETPEIARRAAELITVELAELPAVTDPVQARRPDSPRVHEEREEGNLLRHIEVSKGDPATGFREAEVTLEETFFTPAVEHLFMEPECSVAVPAGYDPSRFGGEVDPNAVRGPRARHPHTTVYVGSQIPYSDRDQVAACLGRPPEEIRIVATMMGGGFGGKEDIAGQIHAALLAEKTGRPVKLLFSRSESMLVHPKRHATRIRVRIGASRDGRLRAFQAELYGDGGAYASLSDHVMTRATTHASGPYDIPHVRSDCFAMYTNNPPSGAFRGFGVTQSCFAVETAMDMLAERLGMDPITLREINALQVGSVTCTGQKLRESVGLKKCIARVREEMHRWHERQGRPFAWQWREGSRRYAWGFAAAYKNSGLGGGADDKAEARLVMWNDEDGRARLEIRISSAEMGQGLPEVLAAIAAEELNFPLERISVLLGDTDFCPDGGPTTASRQSFVSGNAVRGAARLLRSKLLQEASARLELPPDRLRMEDGVIQAEGKSVSLPVEAAVAALRHREGECAAQYLYRAPETRPLGQGGDMHFAFGFAAQAALCSVDEAAGAVNVELIIAATDVGRALNPLALEGQIEGGIAMGLGMALMEEFPLKDGYPLRRTMRDYPAPRMTDVPPIISMIVEEPTSTGPAGAKGIGELPSIPTAPAIVNAISRAVGRRFTHLPVTARDIRQALERTAEV